VEPEVKVRLQTVAKPAQHGTKWSGRKRLIFSQNFENHGAVFFTCGTVDYFRNAAFQAEEVEETQGAVFNLRGILSLSTRSKFLPLSLMPEKK
jgi:hypothetical protein